MPVTIERTETGARAGTPSVPLALAAAEGMRLVRHPLMLLSTAIAPLMLLARTWDLVPLLHTDDAVIAESLLPLAIASMLVSNAAVLRARRLAELLTASPASRATLTLAHLGAQAYAFALGAGVVVADLVLLFALGGVGAPDGAELLTGPLVVVVAGALGVMLASWIRWRPGAMVGSVAVVSAALFTLGTLPGSLPRWLSPYVVPPSIVELDGPRPAAAHAVYLVGIAIAVGVLALARHGTAVKHVTVGVTAAALIVAGMGSMRGSLRFDPIAAERATIAERSCSSGVCLHPDYEYLRARIERVGGGLRAMLPHAIDTGDVVQRVIGGFGRDPGAEEATQVGLRWGRGEAAADYEFGVAYQLALRATGMPTGTFEYRPSEAQRRFFSRQFRYEVEDVVTSRSCWATDEARAIVALWLAARSTPGAEAHLRREAAAHEPVPRVRRLGEGVLVEWCCDWYSPGTDEPGARPVFPAGVILGDKQLAYAVALLDRPDELVLDVWDTVVDPDATTAHALRLWGIEPLPEAREVLDAAGLDPSSRPSYLDVSDQPREPRCRDVG